MGEVGGVYGMRQFKCILAGCGSCGKLFDMVLGYAFLNNCI